MKKLFIIFTFSILIISNLIAQNMDYQSHYSKGKEYEKQGKWISALGEYYDAMVSEPNENGYQAYFSWETIATALENGNPGIGNYDEFDFIDNWLSVLQNYEQYWTENCPVLFFFEKPERLQLNRENKTADYQLLI